MLVSRPLAGRYAFTKRIRGTQRTIIWLARDKVTGQPVVASVVPSARAAGLAPAEGLSHIHAASILQIIETPDAAEIPADEPLDRDSRVVVAEYIEGRNLQQRVDAGPIAAETAAEWMASAADALVLLHQKGAVHGAIAPRALVVVRTEPAIVPVLTHLIVPPSGAYCSPERVTGGGPSEADDTWALTATLYTALSRRVPFQGASRTELARAIVAAAPRPIPNVDPGLWDILLLGLTPDRARRLSTAVGLRDVLRDWMEHAGVQSLGDFAPVEAVVGASEPPPNVGDLSLVAALERPESAEAMAPLHQAPSFSDTPPPEDVDDITGEALELPATAEVAAPVMAPSAHPARASIKSAPYIEAKRSPLALPGILLAVALASAGIGLGIGKVRSLAKHDASPVTAPAPREPAPPKDETAPPSEPGSGKAGTGPPPAASASASAEPPTASAIASASPPLTAPADVTACVRAVLPEGTLKTGSDVDVSYLCKQGDLWGIARKLDLAVAQHGQGPGLVLWAHLARFDLAAIALLFQRCCPADAPLVTATPKGVCMSLPAAVDDLRRNPTPENIDRYAEGVDCFVSRGVRYPTDWWDRVGPKDARGYFDQLQGALRSGR